MSNRALRPSRSLLSDPGFQALKTHLIDVTGLYYYSARESDLSDRCMRRMDLLGLKDCYAYLQALKQAGSGTQELDILVTDLTIGETYFFRHKEQFQALLDSVIPDIIQKNQAVKKLRIWSAGCSIGAEAYSLAILLHQSFAQQLQDWDVSILGTDINRNFLEQATSGVYDDWSFRAMSDALRTEYFVLQDKKWKIDPELKNRVTFRYHNLLTPVFPSLVSGLPAFDLIVCRNVMIYFSPEIVSKIVPFFEQALSPDGWLMVGHAEPNPDIFTRFESVNFPSASFYQKLKPKLEVASVVSPSALEFLKTPFKPAAARDQTSPSRTGSSNPFERLRREAMAELRKLADLGQFDSALELCARLNAEDPINPTPYFYRGLILAQQQNRAESDRAFQRAIELDGEFVLAHYYLGLSRVQSGDSVRAASSFQTVLEMLSKRHPSDRFADGDGITALEMADLSRFYLKKLRAA